MKSYLGFVAYFFGLLGALLGLDAAFSASWDLPDSSTLGFFAAAGVLLLPLLLFRRGKPPLFQEGTRWSRDRVLIPSVAFGGCALLFLLVWGVVIGDRWTTNLAWAAGGGAAIFGVELLVRYVGRFVRRREARKRGIDPEEYKLGPLARRLAWTVGILVGLYTAIGVLIDLTDAL